MPDGVAIGALVPHPPIVVPEVGGRDAQLVAATAHALGQLGAMILEAGPDTVVMITPHGPVSRSAAVVLGDQTLKGDLGRFGAPQVEMAFEADSEYTEALLAEARRRDLVVRRVTRIGLDHGLTVPLYFLKRSGVEARLVAVTVPWWEAADLAELGRVLAAAAVSGGRKVAIVASGDLSHRLQRGAPAGYSPRGAEFDRAVVRLLEQGQLSRLSDLEVELVEAAGECGLKPLQVLAGALADVAVRPRLLSYEGPFGVGYAVAAFVPEHPLVGLARQAIEEYVRTGVVITPPTGLAAECGGRAGAFVSLKKGGRLRGCIGTVQPTRANLAEEVIHNAIAAATDDPRFPPVSPLELDDLELSVDVLEPAEPVHSTDQLDPRRYGVIVRKGRRSGLLLPDLEGIDSVEEQVAIACQKAGLRAHEPGIELYRFQVRRYR